MSIYRTVQKHNLNLELTKHSSW